MSSKWTVSGPQKLVLDGGVEALQVRVAGGAVNVVGVEEGPARLEGARLKATTVSGGIALLRRPTAETDEVTEKES